MAISPHSTSAALFLQIGLCLSGAVGPAGRTEAEKRKLKVSTGERVRAGDRVTSERGSLSVAPQLPFHAKNHCNNYKDGMGN